MMKLSTFDSPRSEHFHYPLKHHEAFLVHPADMARVEIQHHLDDRVWRGTQIVGISLRESRSPISLHLEDLSAPLGCSWSAFVTSCSSCMCDRLMVTLQLVVE